MDIYRHFCVEIMMRAAKQEPEMHEESVCEADNRARSADFPNVISGYCE